MGAISWCTLSGAAEAGLGLLRKLVNRRCSHVESSVDKNSRVRDVVGDAASPGLFAVTLFCRKPCGSGHGHRGSCYPGRDLMIQLAYVSIACDIISAYVVFACLNPFGRVLLQSAHVDLRAFYSVLFDISFRTKCCALFLPYHVL